MILQLIAEIQNLACHMSSVSVSLYLSTSTVLPRKMVIFKVYHHRETRTTSSKFAAAAVQALPVIFGRRMIRKPGRCTSLPILPRYLATQTLSHQ